MISSQDNLTLDIHYAGHIVVIDINEATVRYIF